MIDSWSLVRDDTQHQDLLDALFEHIIIGFVKLKELCVGGGW